VPDYGIYTVGNLGFAINFWFASIHLINTLNPAGASLARNFGFACNLQLQS
jgi:hypothetical protein